MFSKLKNKPKSEYESYYYVKANERHNLSFDKREDARAYKKLLKQSRAQIDSVIVRQEFIGGYIHEERVG